MRGTAMIAALLVLSAAWVWPLAFFAHELFFAHMVQHLLVMNVAALFMAMAWPAVKRRPMALPAVTALQMAALWIWHMPAIFAAAHHSLAHARPHAGVAACRGAAVLERHF